MVTERTTLEITAENLKLLLNQDWNALKIKSNQVWVLKEDVEKALNQIEKAKILLDEDTEKYIEFMLKTFRKNFNINSPPDDIAKSLVPAALDSEEAENPQQGDETLVYRQGKSREGTEEDLCSCHVGAGLYVCRCNDEPKQRGI